MTRFLNFPILPESSFHIPATGSRAGAAMNKRNFVINAVILVVSLGAVLILTDLILRLLYPLPGKGYGLVSKPAGSHLIFESEPDHFRAEHRYNYYGARGPDFPLEPLRTCRIACIGDSFTEGLGAGEDETWPAVLSRLLGDDSAEVLNLGKGGEQPRGYSRLLSSVALPLRVTDVVVCFIPNDMLKIRVAQGLKPGEPFSDPFRERDGIWPRIAVRCCPGWTYLVERVFAGKWRAPLKGMMQSCFTDDLVQRAIRVVGRADGLSPEEAGRIVRRRLDEVPASVLDAARRGTFSPAAVQYELVQPGAFYRVRLQDFPEPHEVIGASLTTWLTWYRDTCVRFDVRPWVLYIPQAPLVSERNYGIWPDEHPVHQQRKVVFGDTSVRDLLSLTCRQAGIPFLDTTDTLMANRGRKLFLRHDTHPTPLAYALVAEVVARQMRPALPGAQR